MSLRTPRRILTVGLLAVALALPGAVAAGADPGRGTGGPSAVSPARGPVGGGTEVAIEATDPPAFVQVSTGDAHTLAVTADGVVHAWGTGGLGQLGLGDVTEALEPTPIDRAAFDGDDVVEVAAGADHSIARTRGGAVYTWGGNWYGQLGLGPGAGLGGSATPARVALPAGAGAVVQVDAGQHFAVAVSETGVYTWGRGQFGRLGTGSLDDVRTPTLVAEQLGGSPVAQVSAGRATVIARTASGVAWAWGGNGNGRLGAGIHGDSVHPVEVDTSGALSGHRVVHVAIGISAAYAVTEDGSMVAWGSNTYGQLGTGEVGLSTNPAPLALDLDAVPSGARIVEVAATHRIALARDAEGRVYGWGDSSDGVLAGGRDATRPTVLEYDGELLSGVTVLAMGPVEHTFGQRRAFAVTEAGDVLAWGTGHVGQLGLGAPADQQVEAPRSVHTAMTEVRFGDAAAAEVRRVGAVVHAVTPPHAAGAVDVHVRTGGTTLTHPGAFAYGVAPALVGQPDVTTAARPGEEVVLTATASSSAVLAVEWQVEGAAGGWADVDAEPELNVDGTTWTTRLTVTAPDEPEAAARYRVVLTNDFGTVTAHRAVRSVTCPTIVGAPHAAVAGEPYEFAFGLGPGAAEARLAADGGPLPEGLALSVSGVLSGTPTTPGTYPLRVLADDPAVSAECGVATVDVELVVHEPVTLAGDPPPAEVGVAYSYAFTVGGTPEATLSVASGTLPPGLALDPGGTVAGVPVQAGDFAATIAASNGVGADARIDVVVRVEPASGPGPGPGPGAGAPRAGADVPPSVERDGRDLAATGAGAALRGAVLAATLLVLGGSACAAVRRRRGRA
ncbi:RCC1 domain-containing protein [Cellulomonas pakistanensis]|uniref:RCC1-like domain-containing protein n=1 Tax=Cellulomonas pakistanensis TaxID=992287 RepID=A0A919U4P9_9CELL|nr:putative Ig domain-containing protein [Cellulomonas pakistanensis]GIG35289.1 hypothetical protein Cpa01nite_06700 [Cellulomonas pakistanensis]